MSIPDTWDLSAEVVGLLLLAELDCDGVTVRFILNDEGFFTDTNGNQWMGSKLLSMSELAFPVNGEAPLTTLTFSYTFDADVTDVVSTARSEGAAAIKGRPARFYLQYIGQTGEMFAPVHAPLQISKRTMRSLEYMLDGPQSRALSVKIESPFEGRSKPVNGKYTDADQRRRFPGNPSLEFMPTNNSDDQQLFGL
jgi:hypothetical protein